MSTNDVPGYDPANRDELGIGSWAEHADGSLILVESTEGGRVIFSVFDPNETPVMEYRHAMPEADFKKAFSWKSGEAVTDDRWTWHDKTPFDWDRVIREGAKPGVKYASATDQLTAAQRVAEALNLSAASARPRPGEGLREVRRLAQQLADALGTLA